MVLGRIFFLKFTSDWSNALCGSTIKRHFTYIGCFHFKNDELGVTKLDTKNMNTFFGVVWDFTYITRLSKNTIWGNKLRLKLEGNEKAGWFGLPHVELKLHKIADGITSAFGKKCEATKISTRKLSTLWAPEGLLSFIGTWIKMSFRVFKNFSSQLHKQHMLDQSVLGFGHTEFARWIQSHCLFVKLFSKWGECMKQIPWRSFRISLI